MTELLKMTRERLASMADDELLVYERERHGNPYKQALLPTSIPVGMR